VPQINIFEYPNNTERLQREKLTKLKLTRDNEKVTNSLNALKYACKNNKNLFPYCIECAKSRCSEGEMFKVIKNAFGLWHPPTFW